MEEVVGVDRNDEYCGIEKISSSLSLPMSIADPVVYKLVRVEGDGRFVPATEDEVMEVEDFLVDDKTEMREVGDVAKTAKCTSEEESAAAKLQLECSQQGLSCLDNTEADTKILTSQIEAQVFRSPYRFTNTDQNLQSPMQGKQVVPSSKLRVNESNNDLSESVVEFSKPPDGKPESGSSTSSTCNNSKPSSVCNSPTLDFSKLKGEICFDKLSIRELHGLFKATFGRETTVKDKLWLKRRIAMGLTNSCDIPTTTFTIIDYGLVNKGNKESCKDENDTFSKGSPVEEKNVISKNSPTSRSSQMKSNRTVSDQMEDHLNVSGKRSNDSTEPDLGSEDPHIAQRALKRVRKPTKRYIEELSESEPRDSIQKGIHSAKNIVLGQIYPKFCIRPVKSVSLNERIMLTRLDSLGGSGVQIPCVSRVRRSRPRENIKALMKFHRSSVGMAAHVVKKTTVVIPKVDSEYKDKVLKSRHAFKQKPPLTSEDKKDEQCSAIITVQLGKNMGPKQADSSEEASSDDNVATVPTAKGGMRRKHHKAWSLVEVMKLIEGVSKCGAGRWSEIKRLAFASYSYRTSVDLKDKWRNLLKASLAPTPPDEGMNSRKNATSVPIPAPILLRVRELAEMHLKSPPNLGSNSPAGVSGKSPYGTRSGYL